MKVFRIIGAYICRATKRHSTLFLLLTFTVSFSLLLQLYTAREQEPRNENQVYGDFDYKPGEFLKGRQPNENVSYCRYNYGLPRILNWNSFVADTSPEGGMRGSYRVIYDAVKGVSFDNMSAYNAVTYATHATPEYIYHVTEIARYWDGPISLAVYTPNFDLDSTIQIVEHLCHCYSGMARVAIHLFYHKHSAPKMGRDPESGPLPPTTPIVETYEESIRRKINRFKSLTNETKAAYIENAIKLKIQRMTVPKPHIRSCAPYLRFNDCSGLESDDFITYRALRNFLYPINVGRNAARVGTRTNYFIVSDIELLPSAGLSGKFSKMLRRLIGDKNRDKGNIIPKVVFVVPIFEVEKGAPIPRRKEELVQMVAAKQAMYFHQTTCTHCQRFPGMQTWLQRPPTNDVQPMMSVKREYPYHRWEPVYFGTNRDPWYSELLSWEGQQDKMPQMLELCLRDYRMVILDGAFLCHPARESKPRIHNVKAETENARQYARIINLFRRRYKVKKECKLFHGFKIVNTLALNISVIK